MELEKGRLDTGIIKQILELWKQHLFAKEHNNGILKRIFTDFLWIQQAVEINQSKFRFSVFVVLVFGFWFFGFGFDWFCCRPVIKILQIKC